MFNLKNAFAVDSTVFLGFKRFLGITFIECIVVLSIAALLLLSAMSWTSTKHTSELNVLIQDLQTAIHYTKMQALSAGQPLVLEALDNDWSLGMTLSSKITHKYLHQWTWHAHYWHIQWYGAQHTKKIVIANNPGQAMSNGRFIVTNKQTQQQVSVVLNRLGRTYVRGDIKSTT